MIIDQNPVHEPDPDPYFGYYSRSRNGLDFDILEEQDYFSDSFL